MIDFFSETDFRLDNPEETSAWIERVAKSHHCTIGEISFIFCSDEFLYDINKRFLGHDTFTDIISFDESLGKELHGEIYISIDRVRENARTYQVTQEDELDRVIIHGILHMCGFKDKSEEEAEKMRMAENNALLMRHNL